MQDLSGPKIRTGELKNHQPIELTAGNALRIVIGDEPGDSSMVSTTYDLAKAVSPGSALLLDDGHIQLRVEGVEGHELRTSVVEGGTLGEHKGINVPGVVLPAGALTPKDVDDLNFGARAGVDYVALSFVQTAEDLRQARAALAKAGTPRISLVAKLERPEAVAHIDDILAACDAIMVARGDLGLELPLERVPRVQKEVTRKARARAIPVIVATQVLESMRTESRPTRAEVSDAANAVDDGVDAIMLAGETATGKFPVRTVQTLDLIIRDAEQMPPHVTSMLEETHLLSGPGRALCEAALTLAGRSDAAAIVAVTRGGKTARVLSALHPRAPIYAATNSRERGAAAGARLGRDAARLRSRLRHAAGDRSHQRDVGDARFIAPSSVIVVVSISPDLSHGSSNFLKLERV
jgi:pyruvate kinase